MIIQNICVSLTGVWHKVLKHQTTRDRQGGNSLFNKEVLVFARNRPEDKDSNNELLFQKGESYLCFKTYYQYMNIYNSYLFLLYKANILDQILLP